MHCVAVEHIFSHVRAIRVAVLCAVEDKMDGICTYLINSFPHVYDYFPCSLWNGVIMFIINVLCAFAWTYMDLFIILMSVALADKFQQLKRCLQSVQGKVSLLQQIQYIYNFFFITHFSACKCVTEKRTHSVTVHYCCSNKSMDYTDC
jgi:hypothetical protein